MSTFVGRTADIGALHGLLGRRRLVTLVGPGGVGKTRLAVEAVRRLPLPPTDGVWMCDFGPVEHGRAVTAAIAETLGLPASSGLHDKLLDFCAPRSFVLLLDNCEHLAGAIATVAGDILRRSPSVRVLATSREPLGVNGERLFDVPPLDVETDAVRLFVDRVHAAGAAVTDDDDRAVARLSRRLDGLPLAIEMAAPWARTMSLRDLDGHLDARLNLRTAERAPDERHRTLRDVMEWSYRRLSGAEQCLFQRLSVFRGGLSLEAAAAVAGWRPLAAGRVPELLHMLVERSMLVPVVSEQRSRFRMLETVAEYAESMRDEPNQETVARHAAYFADVADYIAQGVRGPDEARWARMADLEMPNLRSAASRAVDHGSYDEAVRIPAALYLLVLERLRSDVARWAHPCLRYARRVQHASLPALTAVVALGELQIGRLHEASVLAGRAIGEAGDTVAARFGHHVLSELAFATGRLATGLRHAGAAVRLADEADDRYLAAHAFGNRCLLLGYAGEHERARSLVAEFRHRARAVGSPTLQATADYIEGELLLDYDPARATPLLDRAVATAHAADSAHIEGAARLSAITARARHGDPRDALRAFPGAIRHWSDRGDWTHQLPTLRNLVVVLAESGAHEAAATLFGGVEVLGRSIFGDERRRMDAARAELFASLGSGRASALLRDGKTMEPHNLVRFALTSIGAGDATKQTTGPG